MIEKIYNVALADVAVRVRCSNCGTAIVYDGSKAREAAVVSCPGCKKELTGASDVLNYFRYFHADGVENHVTDAFDVTFQVRLRP